MTQTSGHPSPLLPKILLIALVLLTLAILLPAGGAQLARAAVGWTTGHLLIVGWVVLAVALIAVSRRQIRAVGHRVHQFLRRHIVIFSITTALVLWLFVFLIPNIFIFIKPGEAGVLWRRFGGGTITEYAFNEGTHLILPWNKMYIYNVRLQNRTQTFEVLSREGLLYKVDIAIRFRAVREDLGMLHQNIGPNYVDTMVFPEIGSNARGLMAQYRADEVYTINRLRIEQELLSLMKRQMMVAYLPDDPHESYMHVENILIQRIILPDKVANAIENKLAQEQIMLEYDYRLTKETKEAERKRIEATGIRDFQDIVKEGISDQLLKWKGINATVELATSPNSKVVVIGAGDGGLPLILGGFEQSAPSTTVASPLEDQPRDVEWMSSADPRPSTTADDAPPPARPAGSGKDSSVPAHVDGVDAVDGSVPLTESQTQSQDGRTASPDSTIP